MRAGMRSMLKQYLPEPVQRPLRWLRDGVQRLAIKRLFRKHLNLQQLNRIFRWNRYWYFATYADNKIIARHNADFVRDGTFAPAYRFAKAFTKEDRAPWSVYLLQWAARQAVKVPGDFVECGTARGFAAAMILASVDLAGCGKRFFLFDSWSGVLPAQLTENERRLYGTQLPAFIRQFSGYFDEVKHAFARFPFVTLVKGYVPRSLSQAEIESVCFLHLDMNAMHPELEALPYFFPRLQKGAWVVLDDYGQPGRIEQKRGMDRLAEELHIEIFASPTGQGIMVKS